MPKSTSTSATRPAAKKPRSKATIPTAPDEIARQITTSPVHEEMRDSFMPYALSVTTARAIPDVRDGLKPVQRRILFAMSSLGLRPSEPFRKSAAVVGEVMGKYHPHGDGAIYEALVRLGQPFAMSQTLIDPKGNFGSLDDPPAAYRYTEARLTASAMTLVAELGEETVDFVPNFDGEQSEPVCLPAALPNLLVNGASGIAVGMATTMAPHNLGEVAAVIKHALGHQRPKPTTDELMKHLPAPDFPSGALIVADEGLRSAYETGKGTVRVRARVEVEHATAKRDRLVVTELPYMVGPERVLTKIRQLMQAGKLPQVAAVNDLSDRHSGLRLVIECRPGAGGRGVLADLYRLTPLEDNFSINNVALVNGVPTALGLLDLCKHYIDHRLDVIERRTQYRLDRAAERAHILEGLLKALDEIDTVITIIRSSADADEARGRLIAELVISQEQANHILDMQLRRLTALEADKLRAELEELQAAIAGFKKLLGSKTRQRTQLRKELDELVADFGAPRRSSLIGVEELEAFEELAKAEKQADRDDALDTKNRRSRSSGLSASEASAGAASRPAGQDADSTVVTLSTSGLLGRHLPEGPPTAKPARHDLIQTSLETSTLDVVYAVTDRGRLLNVEARSVPEMVRGSRGASVTEMFSLNRGEKVVGLLAASSALGVLQSNESLSGEPQPGEAQAGQTHASQTQASETQTPVALVTRQGQVKRVDWHVVTGPRRRINSLINLADGDRVVAAFEAPAGTEIVIVSSDGQILRTAADGISIRGPSAGAVSGIKLKGSAHVIAAGRLEFGSAAVFLTEAGNLKATDLAAIKSLKRDTGGVGALKLRGEASPGAKGGAAELAVTAAWVGRLDAAAALIATNTGTSSAGSTSSSSTALLPVRLRLETTPQNAYAAQPQDAIDAEKLAELASDSTSQLVGDQFSVQALGEYRYR